MTKRLPEKRWTDKGGGTTRRRFSRRVEAEVFYAGTSYTARIWVGVDFTNRHGYATPGAAKIAATAVATRLVSNARRTKG